MRDNNRNRNSENFYPSERAQENSPALSELAKKEQEHRHQWQDKYLQTSSTTFRAGQFCGFIYNLALLYLVYALIQNGEKDLALKIFVLNIAIIAFALLVTSLERRISTRKPPRRGFNNNRGRNDRRDGGERRRPREDNRRSREEERR
jgi:hypothetical protein